MRKLSFVQFDLLHDVAEERVSRHDNGNSVVSLYSRSAAGSAGPRTVTSQIAGLERLGLVKAVERRGGWLWQLTEAGRGELKKGKRS